MSRALLAATLVLALGCASDPRDAAAAVRAYDDALILAYRAGDRAGLEPVATARERKKIGVLLDLKKDEGLVLESELARLDVEAADRLGPDRVKVRTSEAWRYRDRPVAPGKPAGPAVEADMTLEYTVVRQDGRWKVDEVRMLTSRASQAPARGSP
jgi:hypothetical protein